MGWSDFKCLMWLTWNTTPKLSTLKLVPPVDTLWKGLRFKTLCFSFFNLFFIFLFLYSPVSLLLVSFILSSHSIWCFLSFPVAAAVSASGPSMGAVLAAQQSLGTCTQTWYTLYSINSELCKHFPTRTRNSHTWSRADRSHTNLHPDSLSSTSQCECMTDLHCLKHCQLLIPALIPVAVCEAPRRSPTAQEAQREDDKLSIRPGSGEFSSCLHRLWDPSLSRPHVWSREALIWLHLCPGHTWAETPFTPSPPCFSYAALPKIVTLQERGETFSWRRPLCLDVIVVKGTMNWFIRRHRKLHFKWMQ